MTTPSTGIIKLSDIRNVFGGTGITKLSDYYSNSITNYTTGVSGIPLIGSLIKFSNFYNKSKNQIIDISKIYIISNDVSASFINPSNNIYYYVFSSTLGTNTITFTNNTTCEILIVGGGGGGGGGFCGGGASGGAIYYNNAYTFTSGQYTINIGTNGVGGKPYSIGATNGTNGTSSTITFNSSIILSANGGMGGGNPFASNGGNTSSTVVTNGNSVITNYTGQLGKNDGQGNYSGGGGAGAGGNAGLPGVTSGYGGNGYQSSITGTSIYYAGGGGGESYVQSTLDGLGNNNYGGGGRGGKPDNVYGNPGIPGCFIIKILNGTTSNPPPPPPPSWPPTPVQSNYNNFGLPWPVASTYYEWIAGARGINLSRSTGSTFNNLGSDNYQNRPNFINYQSLILQAQPGDSIRFEIRNGAISNGDYEVNSLLLHLGSGWFWGLLTNSTPSITHLLDSAWQLNSRAFIEDISN
jgi:hypothetical protein